ncbi:MAG: ABC transporter substrate-binding protein [Chloroflexi bacterium]|nr:ABC transporter substrate-binding protein [Chloroflexota bacterium]
MKGKLLWLIVGSIVVLAMLLASCAPTTTTTTTTPSTTTTTTTTTTEQPTTTTTAPTTTTETKPTGPVLLSPETPKYGGTFTKVLTSDPVRFDEYWSKDNIMDYYQDSLVTGDWAKGPAGTNEVTWMWVGVPSPYYMTGGAAESWDLPGNRTVIYHLRKGVRFALDPNSEASRLVNGRELVADDVIKGWERRYTNPASYLSTTIVRSGIVRMDAPDKYTVVVQWTMNPAQGREFEARLGWGFQLYEYIKIEAPEVAKKYGDLRDWRNAVGTGSYMLTDYIPGSMITFKRNPNYWMKDPIHPENQLPYVETTRSAIIPDLATRLSAIRTGKVDHLYDVLWSDAESLIKTNPELKYNDYLSASIGAGSVAFRVNKPEQPWYKQEVRQALTMAIDYKGIVDGVYQGHAQYPAFPIAPHKEFIESGAYITLDKLPADIQELFSYNPTKAKQMLADAGYPSGFKASIIGQPQDADMLSIIKAYWKDVGVDLSIELKEPAVFSSISTQHTHSELLFANSSGTYPLNLMNYLPGEWHNYADYTGAEMSAKALELDDAYFDLAKVGEIFSEFSLHLYRLANYVGMPQARSFVFWQPWVQNYHGEYRVGNAEINFFKYIWVDMDLKAQMKK